MKKKFVTYNHEDKIKKAVLDDNLLNQYQQNPSITNIKEYDNETLMERRYAEALGVSGKEKKTLLD